MHVKCTLYREHFAKFSEVYFLLSTQSELLIPMVPIFQVKTRHLPLVMVVKSDVSFIMCHYVFLQKVLNAFVFNCYNVYVSSFTSTSTLHSPRPPSRPPLSLPPPRPPTNTMTIHHDNHHATTTTTTNYRRNHRDNQHATTTTTTTSDIHHDQLPIQPPRPRPLQ